MQLSRTDLKTYSSLNRKSKRIEHGLFIAEGAKVCKELLSSNFVVEQVFCTEENSTIFPDSKLISNKDAERISNQKNHSGIIAIAKIPDTNQIPLDETNDIIILENINDPGNLGTIIRTLDWFGFSQVICSENSVDTFNPKTIMASMGSVFRIQPHYLNIPTFLSQTKTESYGAYMNGLSVSKTQFKTPSIIIFGNESHGISTEVGEQINNKISIPGNGQAESLNLSNSSSIIISELYNKRN
jgi:TrmH family RNA methyltransferase